MKKILITGAAGYLGRGMIIPFKDDYDLRLMDIAPISNDTYETMTGDVTDLEQVRKAVAGVDAVIIAHMVAWSRDGTWRREPPLHFDVNVKGAANLYFAGNDYPPKNEPDPDP